MMTVGDSSTGLLTLRISATLLLSSSFFIPQIKSDFAEVRVLYRFNRSVLEKLSQTLLETPSLFFCCALMESLESPTYGQKEQRKKTSMCDDNIL